MVLAELNGLGRTNPNIQKCMGTMKQVFSWLPLRTLCCKAAAAFQALVLPRSRDVVAAPELRHPSSPACQSETLCLQKLNMDVLPNQSHLIAALPPFDWFDCKTFWVLIPCVFRSFGLIPRTDGFEYSQTAGTVYTFELSQDPHMQVVGNCHMSMFRCTASTKKRGIFMKRNDLYQHVSTNWLQDSEIATFMYCMPSGKNRSRPRRICPFSNSTPFSSSNLPHRCLGWEKE